MSKREPQLKLGQKFELEDVMVGFRERWASVDTAMVGRLLRSHLVLEHVVREYVAHANPGLGDLEAARLSFAQVVELLPRNGYVNDVLPGIKQVNALRNKFAHRLDYVMVANDLSPMKQSRFFRDLLTKGGEIVASRTANPLSTLELFCSVAYMLLQTARMLGEDVPDSAPAMNLVEDEIAGA
jgi:hypothetical protein